MLVLWFDAFLTILSALWWIFWVKGMWYSKTDFKGKISLGLYRVFHKFSHTIDIAFVDKWFIWWLSLQNTKFLLISYTHFQKISLRSLIHDLSYSLQNNQRSNSKFAQLHFFAIMKDKIDKTCISASDISFK